MINTKNYQRISAAERAAITDGVLSTLAAMPQPRSKANVIAACKRWASSKSVERALKLLVVKGRIEFGCNPGGQYGLSPETRLFSVARGIDVPKGDPISMILKCREVTANKPRERVRMYCERMMRCNTKPTRLQIMKELKLGEATVSRAIKYLVANDLLDDVFMESPQETGLGERDADVVEQRTAQVLAEKLGMTGPPEDWREWRNRLRNRTVEPEWRPGWFVSEREDKERGSDHDHRP